MSREGRAGYILWENREVIDQMMQQMDDFAAQNGGYINRSGVGNFRTNAVVENDDEENESPAEERKEKMMRKGKKSKMMDKEELEEVKETYLRRRRSR